LLDIYWNILTMHGPINFKSPKNISEWQMGFNSAFKGLSMLLLLYYYYYYYYYYYLFCMYYFNQAPEDRSRFKTQSCLNKLDAINTYEKMEV
jgi:hypothetical protein